MKSLYNYRGNLIKQHNVTDFTDIIYLLCPKTSMYCTVLYISVRIMSNYEVPAHNCKPRFSL